MGKAGNSKRTAAGNTLPKAPTGIQGLDEITGGGLPRGRPTLVCGSAGCGKTLLAMEFLVRGVIEYGEPGVFMAFEETAEELAQNVRSLGFDLDELIRQKKLIIDFVRVERNEIEETGEYDLEGLFVRLNYAIDSIGAKRVVLDTIETLFGGLSNAAILRAEFRRLFRWLKDKGVTAVITGERGEGTLTRQGLEEYVSDCVILLDHRVIDQVSTRRLRIVKYRGSTHGTNEYPFLIDEDGISVLPITSWACSTTSPMSVCHRASPGWIPCWAARVFPRQHRAGFGYGGHRQEQRGGTLRQRRLRARRERCLYLRLRGIASADHPEHAVDRYRPGAMGQEGLAAIPRDAVHVLRPGDASGHDSQAHQGVQTGRRRPRSHRQSDNGGHRAGHDGHADAPDGFPEDRRKLRRL